MTLERKVQVTPFKRIQFYVNRLKAKELHDLNKNPPAILLFLFKVLENLIGNQMSNFLTRDRMFSDR